MDKKVENCPNCNSREIKIDHDGECHSIRCSNCGCVGEYVFYDGEILNDVMRKLSVFYWNGNKYEDFNAFSDYENPRDCPFCGGNDIEIDGDEYVVVLCNSCESCGPIISNDVINNLASLLLLKLWNKRPGEIEQDDGDIYFNQTIDDISKHKEKAQAARQTEKTSKEAVQAFAEALKEQASSQVQKNAELVKEINEFISNAHNYNTPSLIGRLLLDIKKSFYSGRM